MVLRALASFRTQAPVSSSIRFPEAGSRCLLFGSHWQVPCRWKATECPVTLEQQTAKLRPSTHKFYHARLAVGAVGVRRSARWAA